MRKVVMQLPNKVKLSVIIAAISLSTSAIAASTSYDVGFSTVPDIALIQKTAMDFGSGLGLASGSICAMAISDDATAATYVGDGTMGLASTGGDTVGANFGDLSGVGCIITAGDKGTPGLYEISGVPGGTVNVTVNNITSGTAFNFTASGCVGTYNGAGNGDNCTAFTPGTPLPVTLANAADTVGNTAGAGIPSPGITRISVGGTITSAQTNTPGTLLTEAFTIDVTY